MKRALFIGCIGVVLAAAAACASSEREPSLSDEPDTGTPLADAAPTDGGGETDADDAPPELPECSSAGWCPTDLPRTDLVLRDIAVFPGRAFAVAESATVGVKVLEWNDDTATWSFIDDNSQNESGRGRFVGRLWAASSNEVFYGVAPRTIYHGKRDPQSTSPSTAWTWTFQQLEDHVPAYTPNATYPEHYRGLPRYRGMPIHGNWTGIDLPSLGVFGTSTDDVYAWYGNTIYRLSQEDGGDPTWAVEYVADDRDRPDELLVFFAATATAAGDIWFAGGRGGAPGDTRLCPVLVRKSSSSSSYERVADGQGAALRFPLPPKRCEARPGVPYIDAAEGWLTDIQAGPDDTIIGLNAAYELVRVAETGGGTYSFALAKVPRGLTKAPVLSFWRVPGDETVWIGGTNVIVRGHDLWADTATYEISPISRERVWLDFPVRQVRGTSNNHYWAVGARHALRKITP